MTKLTTQGQKDSANTDLPQFHDPDDQDIDLDTGLDTGLDTEDTVPPDETHIQNDPETGTIEIDPEEAAVLAYFTNSRRNQFEALPEPTKRDLQREEQIWAEPEDDLASLDDPVRVYLREIGGIPLIGAKQEQYLARRIEEMAHLDPIPRTKPPRHAQRPATPGRGTWPGAAPHASPGLYPGRAPDERPTPAQSAAADPRRGP